MPLSDEFLAYVLDQFSLWGDVTARKMFGGAGLYRDGKMFGIVADDVGYLKVDDSNREHFKRDFDMVAVFNKLPLRCYRKGLPNEGS